MTIRVAHKADAEAVTGLALRLWPDHAYADLLAEMSGYIDGAESAIFLAEAEGQPIGFAQCGLRHDYVEGTGSSPVGYLEGIYVVEDNRRAGVATKLAAACEAWARAHDCREFASDCELSNALSIAFHLGAGFLEAGRLVCFTKEL